MSLYLKSTIFLCLRYARLADGKSDLHGYVDADYASNDPDGMCSRTGYVLFACGAPVIWRSTLQTIVAQSSCESEFIALNAIARECEWARVVYNELFNSFFDQRASPAVPVFADNLGANQLAKTFMVNKRSKHFRVRLYYVRQQVREGVMQVFNIPTDQNLGDPFTKILGPQKFIFFRDQLVVAPVVTPSLE